jgi:hypothetical protein
VLSGHSHLYERYTRTMKADGRQIPFVVAGNGGYYNLSKLKTDAAGKKPTPGRQTEPDGQGNTITLEQYNDTNYGFLRISVSASQILVEALGVSSPTTTSSTTTPIPPPIAVDSFVVDLAGHKVSAPSAAMSPTTHKTTHKKKAPAEHQKRTKPG